MMFKCVSYMLTMVIPYLPYNANWAKNGEIHKLHLNKDFTDSYYTIENNKYKITYAMECQEYENEN